MSTNIEWADSTWNPSTGCTQVSPGCDHCYAKTLVDTRLSKNPISERFGHPFEDVMLHPDRLYAFTPRQKPRRIFVNSMSDLFHADVPDEFVARVWITMLSCPQHQFQVLTKRPERMRRLVQRIYENAFPFVQFTDVFSLERRIARNIWLGVSVESNDYAWRAEMLRETPAALRFLSIEPMLGPVDKVDLTDIDWVIVGGESGRGARPMDLRWVRDVRDRCAKRSIPFFLKQLGGETKKRGHDEAVLDGVRHVAWPA